MKRLTRVDLERLIAAHDYDYHGLLTICTLTLHSGFKAVGYSSCISAESYDRTAGENAAFENAFDKLWELEGYRRKAEAHDAKPKVQLAIDMKPLTDFVRSPEFGQRIVEIMSRNRQKLGLFEGSKGGLTPTLPELAPVVLTEGDARADLAGELRPDNPSRDGFINHSAKVVAARAMRAAGFSLREIGSVLSVSKTHAARLCKVVQ